MLLYGNRVGKGRRFTSHALCEWGATQGRAFKQERHVWACVGGEKGGPSKAMPLVGGQDGKFQKPYLMVAGHVIYVQDEGGFQEPCPLWAYVDGEREKFQ